MADLIDDLVARDNIDAQRIYANGFSNGAGLSYLLACRLTNRYAAIGGVAGAYLLPLDECRPADPCPWSRSRHGQPDRPLHEQPVPKAPSPPPRRARVGRRVGRPERV